MEKVRIVVHHLEIISWEGENLFLRTTKRLSFAAVIASTLVLGYYGKTHTLDPAVWAGWSMLAALCIAAYWYSSGELKKRWESLLRSKGWDGHSQYTIWVEHETFLHP